MMVNARQRIGNIRNAKKLKLKNLKLHNFLNIIEINKLHLFRKLSFNRSNDNEKGSVIVRNSC